MDALTVFGVTAVSAMLVCYALEERAPVFVLCFAGACLLSSAYGFLQGAWPFGMVETVWSAVAVQRWRSRVRSVARVDDEAGVPIACDMSAFTADERRDYHAVRRRVSDAVLHSAVTPSGFVARIDQPTSPPEIAEWLALERRCCPFLDVGLTLKRDRSMWIQIDGPPRAKDFLEDEFADFLRN